MIIQKQGNVLDSKLEEECIKIIIHICNNQYKFGAGFALSLREKWPDVYLNYANSPMILGTNTCITIENEKTIVFNMICQYGLNSRRYIKQDFVDKVALEACLKGVHSKCQELMSQNKHVSIHMPRIGCGLAGSSWDKIEPIINRHISDIDCYVYDL